MIVRYTAPPPIDPVLTDDFTDAERDACTTLRRHYEKRGVLLRSLSLVEYRRLLFLRWRSHHGRLGGG